MPGVVVAIRRTLGARRLHRERAAARDPKPRFYSEAMALEAYDHGRTDMPLLDETIPQNLF